MTNALATPKTTRILLLIAACVVALAYVQWGAARGLAALVGAAISLLNWFALRWFTARLVYGAIDRASAASGSGERGSGVEESGATKAFVALLLIGKIGLLFAAIYVLIQQLHLDPVGLAFGLAVLFIGPVVASLVGGTASLHPSAANAAREER
jgi:hypothetical protein